MFAVHHVLCSSQQAQVNTVIFGEEWKDKEAAKTYGRLRNIGKEFTVSIKIKLNTYFRKVNANI